MSMDSRGGVPQPDQETGPDKTYLALQEKLAGQPKGEEGEKEIELNGQKVKLSVWDGEPNTVSVNLRSDEVEGSLFLIVHSDGKVERLESLSIDDADEGTDPKPSVDADFGISDEDIIKQLAA